MLSPYIIGFNMLSKLYLASWFFVLILSAYQGMLNRILKSVKVNIFLQHFLF